MKKYNLKKIMKRAWAIKKENNDNIFALCLKMAWAEYKCEILPNLEGSEKQVAWAKDIRTKMIEIMKANDFHRFHTLRKTVNNQTSAKWYIENFKIMTATFKDYEYKRRFLDNMNMKLYFGEIAA